LARTDRFDVNAEAAGLVTFGNVAAYVAELTTRVSSVTVYGSIQKLRRVVQLIAPVREIAWLIELEHDLWSDSLSLGTPTRHSPVNIQNGVPLLRLTLG
jgi:hypothetical protein